MTALRDPGHVHWDWDTRLMADGRGPCFPRKITCANVDSETEINGHFLVLEGKRPGERTPKGEVMTMDARVRDGRYVVVVTGDPNGELISIQNWATKRTIPATWELLWLLLKQWADWAGSQPRPHPRSSEFRFAPPTRPTLSIVPDEAQAYIDAAFTGPPA